LPSNYRRETQRIRHIAEWDSALGFMIFVDTLPDTLRFAVKQENAPDHTDDAITDTIEFKRAF
jgi:hypothetical protein